MAARSKYGALLKPFLARPCFTTAEAEKAGIPRRVLARLAKRGVLERIAYGQYRSAAYDLDMDAKLEELALAAVSIPNGVICLISALKYYELTEEIPREHWVAIPHEQRASKRPHVRIVRMRNIKLGECEVKLGKIRVRIFDPERCIIDAFRYLSREIAIKALKSYLHDRRSKPDLNKLSHYAKILRVDINSYIMTLLT